MIDEITREFLEQLPEKDKAILFDRYDNQLPDILKPSTELRYDIGMFYKHKVTFGILKKVGEQYGYDVASKMLEEMYLEFCDEWVGWPGIQEAIDSFKGMGIEDPTVLAATAAIAYDYIFGNIDAIGEEESSPGRTCAKVLQCRIWDTMKSLGIEDKLDCEGGCSGGCDVVAKRIHPKMSAGRRGKTHHEFDYCRCRGDDICSLYFYMEE